MYTDFVCVNQRQIVYVPALVPRMFATSISYSSRSAASL